ncbi:phosphonate ABC transporter ATP-binding protein [Liquorilactobacillus satsumensis]|uniref:phosphonate ABC transporter ATP-binding protein n=1 Tax=Liquorilactobacillus satsumensis TaxID=259059 RepID=UPI001E30FF83|nr:phosphonate ABC transporter ATP-binding protein [Liquorilactobacillus satsumensis]MCC7667753.1 phosphonate ABC transporter ATP-binding protein [Liquorilactobacillus satsumensis]MCP9356916.1 phosphonate ABC transporter ATP-binding protein [Liquorilactobacillus satsumensis]MCP9370863.1 phosphonate ABC transporter ATP-binding protein [Liquorilactobacillus satsumensis]
MLVIKNLTKSYSGQKRSLENVSFAARPGEVSVIIGPSGAGKTTILRSINQLISDDDGQIKLDDLDIRQLNRKTLKKVRHKIGMIFQNYNLIDPLTAIENVLHGRLGAKSTFAGMFSLYTAAEKKEALTLLEQMGLKDFAFKRCSDLSGGQKQRVGIARALMQHPKIILCDEPIASLDPKSTTLVMNILRKLAIEKKIIVLINLHQVEIAKVYADHIIGLNKGKVVFDDRSEKLNTAAINLIYS